LIAKEILAKMSKQNLKMWKNTKHENFVNEQPLIQCKMFGTSVLQRSMGNFFSIMTSAVATKIFTRGKIRKKLKSARFFSCICIEFFFQCCRLILCLRHIHISQSISISIKIQNWITLQGRTFMPFLPLGCLSLVMLYF